jgi:hypothetical protein
MILEPGEKVHVVERRVFTDDVRRHFVGQVLKCAEYAVRLKGYVWVYDDMSGRFVRKPEMRERVITLGGDRLIINVIPPEVSIEEVRYVTDPQEGLLVTDGKNLFLEIAELTARR